MMRWIEVGGDSGGGGIGKEIEIKLGINKHKTIAALFYFFFL
jgi:hypothetical protein